MKWLWSNKFINGPVITTPHSLLPTYACILEMNPRKRAREERDSKRASARDIKERRAPRTLFLASTAAPPCSSNVIDSVCPFQAAAWRGVAPSCCIGGQGRVMQRCARRTCIHAYTGCVPACVYVNQYMCICMRTSLDMYTLCTHVWVYTHTHVHIHTHKHVLKTQTLHSGTQEFRENKKKPCNDCIYIYTYSQIFAIYKKYRPIYEGFQDTNPKLSGRKL